MGVPPRLIDLSVARTFARAKRIGTTTSGNSDRTTGTKTTTAGM